MKSRQFVYGLVVFLAGTTIGRALAIIEIVNFINALEKDPKMSTIFGISQAGTRRLAASIETLIWDFRTGLLIFILIALVIVAERLFPRNNSGI